jgi:arabinofuranosyltransferase
VYSLFVAGQVLFQYLYYGDVFPNTYILKLTGMPLADRISNGLNFIFPFVIQTSFLLAIGISALFLSFSREKLLFVAIFLSTLAYQVYVGGDPWNYWRMLSPVMPLLAILFLFGIVQWISDIAGGRRIGHMLQKLPVEVQIGLLAFMGMLVANVFFLPEIVFYDRPFYVSANEHNVNTALALQEITTSDATAGVLWAGAIPYFSERKGIDFLGKSDRHIAKLPPDLSGKVSGNGIKSLPGHNKYDLSYSIGKLRPTFVQEFKWGGQDLSSWAETRYVKVEYKGMLLYLLKNSPAVLWDRIDGQ